MGLSIFTLPVKVPLSSFGDLFLRKLNRFILPTKSLSVPSYFRSQALSASETSNFLFAIHIIPWLAVSPACHNLVNGLQDERPSKAYGCCECLFVVATTPTPKQLFWDKRSHLHRIHNTPTVPNRLTIPELDIL